MTSTIKVNTITTESGSTLTVGGCGKTVALASGASQTGFGRTGTVDWQTGSIKTTTFTAANGEGYFADTSAGAFTMNLPAGVAGNIVSVVDYTNSFQTYNLTISPNGSDKIGGTALDTRLTTEGQSVTFVYVDGVEGWKNVQDSTSAVTGGTYLSATGGCITTCGNYKMHIFKAPGTFCVSDVSTCASLNNVDFVVVAGGGGGGGQGGGGGAGGYRESPGADTCYTASPLGASPMTSKAIPAAAPFPVSVGGGGAGSTSAPTAGTNGCSSAVFCITSAGGGGGGSDGVTPKVASTGGSGGGGGWGTPGASGNTPPTNPPQGNTGGTGQPNCSSHGGGGGGGAGAVGGNGSAPKGGCGGIGTVTQILSASPAAPTTGEPGPATGRYFAGGGGGNANPGYSGGGTGGIGGGGNGADPGQTVENGVTNTGGGAGSQHGVYSSPYTNGNGGSGIVIIRYKYQ
jgi:hypothetical protein